MPYISPCHPSRSIAERVEAIFAAIDSAEEAGQASDGQPLALSY